MKKIISLVLVVVLCMTAFVGCKGSDDKGGISGDITLSGSSALKPLADLAAEKFMDANMDALITINAGGSGTGLKDVSAGSVDIGNSDVFAEDKLEPSQAEELVDHKVCTVVMGPVINKDLGVESVTTEQLIDIFTLKITNWSEVGGPDEEITLITRPESSGTRAIFNAEALKGTSEVKGAIENDNSGELVTTVSQTKGAIGYVALPYTIGAYADKVELLSIDGVKPSLENAYNGTYNVWGYEHMYTKGEAEGLAKAFIDYMMGDAFGAEIEKMGYGVTSKHTTTK